MIFDKFHENTSEEIFGECLLTGLIVPYCEIGSSRKLGPYFRTLGLVYHDTTLASS